MTVLSAVFGFLKVNEASNSAERTKVSHTSTQEDQVLSIMERCQQLHLWSIGKQRKRKNRWRRVRHSFVPCQLVLKTVDPCSVYPFSHSTLPNHSLHHLYMRGNQLVAILRTVFVGLCSCAQWNQWGENIWSSQFIFGAFQGYMTS